MGAAKRFMLFPLHRHIGGLETTTLLRLSGDKLHRHIGGLESRSAH